MDCVRRGFFRVVNPFNRKESVVDFSPGRLHTVVFWSKDYSRFLDGGYGQSLQEMGCNLFFQFTVNSQDRVLEPGLPPLAKRLPQFERLCRLVSPEAVSWRFDPICFYRWADGIDGNNQGDFIEIADAAAKAGIRACTTSFLDLYAKVKKRAAVIPGFSFLDPPMEKKIAVLQRMASRLRERKMSLFTCCEKKVLENLPPDSGVEAASCVPSHLLSKLYGPDLSLRKDSGQRVKQGCGCRVSVDIGNYHLQPCRHNCLFCYANPSDDAVARKENRESR